MPKKMVITNRYYTKAAIQSAERNNVELINRDGLLALLKGYREVLEEKQRYRSNK